MEKYIISGEINQKVSNVEDKYNLILEKYKDGKITKIDGISVEYPDYRFNVRPSNTEPLLRLCLEAKSQEVMEQKRDEVLALIRS
jgi:phosphomannomutase